MGCDGGLAFIPVHPKATVEEAYTYLSPFFEFDPKGCDWGDASRSDWLRENDEGHNIVVPYGTDIWDHLMADEVMEFVWFLERIAEKSAIQDLTFEDILIERDTCPSWDPPDSHDKKFYRAIENAGIDGDIKVSDWIAGLHKVLQFSKGYSCGSEIVKVSRHETWT